MYGASPGDGPSTGDGVYRKHWWYNVSPASLGSILRDTGRAAVAATNLCVHRVVQPCFTKKL